MEHQKTIVHEAIRGYLLDEYPDKIEEFDIVFKGVWESLEREINFTNSVEDDFDESTQFIDGLITQQAVVSLACFIGYSIAKAALKDSVVRDVPRVLDYIENKLSLKTERPEIVHSIRERIEGIIKKL